MLRFVLTLCIATFSLAAPGLAAPAVTGEFDIDGEPQYITLGPDGNLWTPLAGSTNELARITPEGQVSNFDVPSVTAQKGIVALGQFLWMTAQNELIRITPGATPSYQAFTFNNIITPNGITVGPDGNLWTGSNDKVLRFNVSNPDAPQETTFTVGGSMKGIGAGHGLIWAVDSNDGGVSRVISLTTDGTATPFTLATANGAQEVAAGAPGQVLFTNPVDKKIGFVTSAGAQPPIDIGTLDPFGVVFGQDGAYWLATFNNSGGGLQRVTTDGQMTTLTGASNFGPRQITRGPGNTLWYANDVGKKVGRVSGVEPPAPLAVTLTGIKLSRSKFALAAKKTALAAAVKKGTTLSWTLSGAATTTIRVEKPSAGRRKGKSCAKPTRSNRRAKKCTRFVRVGRAITRIGLPGTNSLAFTGKYGSTKLKPGKYRFSLTAAPAGGSATQPQTKSFTIVKTKRR